ncbi:unnamed protein product [Paramecium primaurelia]|uniref:Alpha/beta hydrolase fold-3 domain-containing protein n=1 Tax=Paramecium primaurelia TaxID=5886 RepID=A0A8S1LT12_PARPR|nr:unnamed protein product [Paramecium primaurelia]
MELLPVDFEQLDQEILAALFPIQQQPLLCEEDNLLGHVDLLFEQIMTVDNHQQLTIDEFKLNCTLIRNTLQDLIQLMKNLIHKYIKSICTINRIQYAVNYLIILKDLYETVLELFANSLEQPSPRFQELLTKYSNNEEFRIKAKNIQDINFFGLQHMNHVFTQDTLKQIIRISHHYLTNHDSQALEQKLIVYNSHLNILVRIFASAIDMNKQDIICLNKNHLFWRQIKAISTYTKLSQNSEQISQSYYNFMKSIRIGHAIFLKKSKVKNSLMRDIIFISSSVWYFVLDGRAKLRAMEHMCDMQVESAMSVMGMVEKPGIKHLIEFGITSINNNIKIYIDPVVSPLTLKYMNKQFQKGILNKITNEPLEYVNKSIHYDIKQHKSIMTKDKTKLRIRILSSKSLVKTNSFQQSFFSQIQHEALNYDTFETIIIHFHGGGFISMSSSSHQNYTREWANQLGIPIFSVDYSLAPKYRYPQAVDDCWQAYHWILNHLQYHFNIKPKKIILAGDSAGGNLCCALTGLAIKFGIKVPDGLLLSYPVLDLKMKYSPSHMHGLEDFLLNHTLMDICIDAYTNHPASYEFDPFRSPNHFSDEIISKFPPVRILVGSKDPLIDHSHRLAHTLIKNKRNVKIIVYEGMSHGFLSFYMLGGMKESSKCIEDSIIFLKELISQKKY